MSKFNLDNYEPVKARKKRFFSDYKDGRILVDIVKADGNEAIIKAKCFKNADDLKNDLPLATGHAQEFKGQGGMANKFAWLENCEESAIGRCLDNAGYATDMKCSREEMIKVKQKEEEEKAQKELSLAIKSQLMKLTNGGKDAGAVSAILRHFGASSSENIVKSQNKEEVLEVLMGDEIREVIEEGKSK